ncbi:hypothetical protein LTR86_000257 [Recurvomyces mirabilis]|nr:hypothetical protein LTR86_000257 [Recurvomyces mirabilis]
MRLQATSITLLLLHLLRQSNALAFVEIRGIILPAPKVIEPEPIVPAVRPPPEIDPGSQTPDPETGPVSETPGAALRPDPEAGTPSIPEIPGVLTPYGTEVVPDLGDYQKYEDAPFSSYDGEWDPFFSKIFDVFEAESTGYYEINALAPEATKAGGPLISGRPTSGQVLSFTATTSSGLGGQDEDPVVTTFDPLKPTDVCAVMSSLVSYCNGGGTTCACYSGTYYVPDQWNTLAARCARYTSACAPSSATTSGNDTATVTTTQDWCQVASVAASYQSYCPIEKISTVAFAAEMVLATATSDLGGATMSPTSTSPYGVAAASTAIPTSTYEAPSTGKAAGRVAVSGVRSIMLACLGGLLGLYAT